MDRAQHRAIAGNQIAAKNISRHVNHAAHVRLFAMHRAPFQNACTRKMHLHAFNQKSINCLDHCTVESFAPLLLIKVNLRFKHFEKFSIWNNIKREFFFSFFLHLHFLFSLLSPFSFRLVYLLFSCPVFSLISFLFFFFFSCSFPLLLLLHFFFSLPSSLFLVSSL